MKKRNIVIVAIAGTIVAGVAYALKEVRDSKLIKEAILEHRKEQMIDPEDIPFLNTRSFLRDIPCIWLPVILAHADEIRDYDDQLTYIECSDEGILTIDSYNNRILIVYDEEDDLMLFQYVGGV